MLKEFHFTLPFSHIRKALTQPDSHNQSRPPLLPLSLATSSPLSGSSPSPSEPLICKKFPQIYSRFICRYEIQGRLFK
ncbi:hypothetical protein V6Z11_D04G112900 [Gossypium hirsutum]